MISFYQELEKIAESKKKDKKETYFQRWKKSFTKDELKKQLETSGTITGALGAGGLAGFLTSEGMKKINIPTQYGKFAPRGAFVPGVAAGISGLLTYKAIRDYLNERKKRGNSRKGGISKNILPNQQQHNERREGHNSKVSSTLFQSDGGGGVPLHSGRGPIYRGNVRDSDGADNNGSGDDKYRYHRKKARNYRFKDPT